MQLVKQHQPRAGDQRSGSALDQPASRRRAAGLDVWVRRSGSESSGCVVALCAESFLTVDDRHGRSPAAGLRCQHGALASAAASSGREQLPQHVRQDAAVPVVVDLDRRVDAQLQRDLLCRRPCRTRSASPSICGSQFAFDPSMSNVSSPLMPRTATLSLGLELQRQHAHADQIAAVDALEALARSTALTPSSCVPLAAQSRDEPVPYSSPANTTVGMPSSM